jgi:regulatory protein
MSNPRQPLSPAQALNRAAALCSRSEQAPSDIAAKLTAWGIAGDEARQVMQSLTDQGFINEQRFARAFVKDRFSFNGWGKIKIAHQLRLKGITAEAINDALTVIDDDLYRQRLTELLKAKWRTAKGREPRAAWAAMMRFAASRGFEAALASECVKTVSQLDVEDD